MPDILLLTNLLDSPSVPILQEAARKMGIEFSVSVPLTWERYVADHGEDALPDVIMTRLGSSAPDEDIAVLASWEQANVPCVNRLKAIETARDKSRSQLAFESAGIPSPPSALISGPDSVVTAINKLGSPPWVLKKPVSCKGLGVELVHSEQELRQKLEDLPAGAESSFVLQQFIKEAAGSDTRVLVVGGTAVVAIRRQSNSDDFRSNLHLGGQASPVTIEGELADISQAAARAIGLDIAGIDLLSSTDGYRVIEANASPGLRGTQATTVEDLGRRILEHVLSKRRQ